LKRVLVVSDMHVGCMASVMPSWANMYGCAVGQIKNLNQQIYIGLSPIESRRQILSTTPPLRKESPALRDEENGRFCYPHLALNLKKRSVEYD
jgi:hypothetical protein